MRSAPFTLQMQSVVYNNQIGNIEKLLRSTSTSVENAVSERIISHAIHRIGDCSPTPLIDNPDVWCKELSTQNLTVEYEYFDANLGHGGGQNRLAENSTADILGIVNPDVVVSPHFVEVLCNEFSDATVGVSEATQIPMEHPKDYDLATRETSFSSGGCLFIDRKLFEELNGFDHETFFMYCDDVDLSWRVRLAGKKLIFCPQASVYHDHRIGNDGQLEVGFAEFYYSAVGGILLAYKWGRPDIAERSLDNLRDDPAYIDAVREIDTKSAEGKLPAPIQGAEKIAVFTPTGFAHYRWDN